MSREFKDGDFTLPPKKRNWKNGTYQIGLFIRYPDGSVTQLINDKADEEMIAAVETAAAEMARPKKKRG